MALKQTKKVVPPIPSDRNLQNFAQVIQDSLAFLYQAGHIHQLVTSDPQDNAGNIGDIYIVDNGTNSYLAWKTSRGWYKAANGTKI